MNLKHLEPMLHSPIHNYIVPGLTSWLVGAPSPMGTVRMFDMTRHQTHFVTPHSHRYALTCYVLVGSVVNIAYMSNVGGDYFARSRQTYKEMGQYELEHEDNVSMKPCPVQYDAGASYSMDADEFHSIAFDRGSKVLIFEGPKVADHSFVLEPVIKGVVVPTHRTEPWMFK